MANEDYTLEMITASSSLGYGAIGDGATNDVAALKTALETCADEGLVLDGLGLTYKIGSSLNLATGKRYRMRNIRIDGSSLAASAKLIYLSGGVPVAKAELAADAATRATSITVDDASELVADGYYLIVTTRGWDRDMNRGCELVRVKSIAGNDVSLYNHLRGRYFAADTVTIEKLDESTGVDFEGVTVIGGGALLQQFGLTVEYGFASRYRNMTFERTEMSGLVEQVCFLTDGDKFSFPNETDNETGYGVNAVGCHDCSYGDVWGRRARHLVTHGASGTAFRNLIGRGYRFGDIVSEEATGSAYDSHAGTDVTLVGNVWGAACTDADTSSPGVIEQGAGAIINSVKLYGFRTDAVMLQSYGGSDEDGVALLSIGSLVAHRCAGQLVHVQNRANGANWDGEAGICDALVSIGHIDGVGVSGLRANPADVGNASIIVRSGRMVTTGGNSVQTSANDDYFGEILVGCDVDHRSTSSSHWPIVQSGSDYATATGQIGGQTQLTDGRWTIAGSNAISNVDADVVIERGVRFPSGKTENHTGLGGVRRPGVGFVTKSDDTSSYTPPLRSDLTVVLHTATLGANRTMSLPTPSGSLVNLRIRVVRSGGGAYALSVAGLRSLYQNQWAEFAWKGAAWEAVAWGGEAPPLTLATDVSVTLPAASGLLVVHYSATQSAHRSIVLPSAPPQDARVRVLRTGGGAFLLTVGGLRTLSQNQWVDLSWAGSAWRVDAAGSI